MFIHRYAFKELKNRGKRERLTGWRFTGIYAIQQIHEGILRFNYYEILNPDKKMQSEAWARENNAFHDRRHHYRNSRRIFYHEKGRAIEGPSVQTTLGTRLSNQRVDFTMSGSFGITCCITAWFRAFCRWGNKAASDTDEPDTFDNEEATDGACSWRAYDYTHGHDCAALTRNSIS